MNRMLQFPDNFRWGTATASYQIEGAGDEDREPCIWDVFCSTPGKVHNGDTGRRACDHYHRFKEDVQLIKQLNTKYYRFSIAWTRIHCFSSIGTPEKRNEAGIQFYNALIDELLENGITPVVTLYHWDLPVAVEDSTGGWAGTGDIVSLFAEYARVCFAEFGDRVKDWITLNEPWCCAFLGYEIGEHAPGDTSRPGDSIYVAGHRLLLSHARAVDVYRREFQKDQHGKIGITLNTDWAEPLYGDKEECVSAARRDMEFELGWFADPIWCGDYPESMKTTVGVRLPVFTEEEKSLLKGSSDFFGLNHYSTHYTTGMLPERDLQDESKRGYVQDRGTSQYRDDEWEKTGMGWSIVPWGFRNLLLYIQSKYDPRGGIVVTENGLAAPEGSQEEMIQDTTRIPFYKGYINAMHEAIEAGVDVRGYFLWSLMDNFEWAFGYEKRFGLYWVDYKTLARVAKPAVQWYARVAKDNAVESDETASSSEWKSGGF